MYCIEIVILFYWVDFPWPTSWVVTHRSRITFGW